MKYEIEYVLKSVLVFYVEERMKCMVCARTTHPVENAVFYFVTHLCLAATGPSFVWVVSSVNR